MDEIFRNDPDLASIPVGAERPKERASVPRICCSLVHRTPGIGAVEALKPRRRGEWTNDDGSITTLSAQWMTCIYQWDCYAEDSVEAERLVRLVDERLTDSVGLLISIGAKDFRFEEELKDHLLQVTDGIECRSIRWRAELEKRSYETDPAIREILVRVLLDMGTDYEAVTRGADATIPDLLTRKFISRIWHVSAASPSGIARTDDYVEGLDWVPAYDRKRNETRIWWTDVGKKPNPGDIYYVRYSYWNNFFRMPLPGVEGDLGGDFDPRVSPTTGPSR